MDRWRAGDSTALSAIERRGLTLFIGKANCATCHVGHNFTDEGFHHTGVGSRSGDPGRARVTGSSADEGAFKTPTLRDVARTAPYMHDGSIPTLEAVIDFYDSGGRGAALDPEIKPLRLTADEKTALAAFLRALTGRIAGGP